MPYKILIVEDDSDINHLLRRILQKSNFETIQAYSGTEAILLLERNTPDIILLDLMLPGMSGENLLLHIKNDLKLDIPILILSAKVDIDNKVALLKSGADDYITKPFVPEELLARIEVALRRSLKKIEEPECITYQELILHPQSRSIYLKGKELNLTSHEYELLYLLMMNPGKVYSRESLYEIIWKGGYYGENNTVNVHVSNIRKKLKEIDNKEEYIQTVYGIGFKLK